MTVYARKSKEGGRPLVGLDQYVEMNGKSKVIKSPIDNLGPGAVLDNMVAEIVMGWHQPVPPNSDWFDGKGMSRSVGSFRPSTRDDHAVEALQKFRSITIHKYDGHWTCYINPWNRCEGETFALAVSRAVVKDSMIYHPPDVHHGDKMEIKQI